MLLIVLTLVYTIKPWLKSLVSWQSWAKFENCSETLKKTREKHLRSNSLHLRQLRYYSDFCVPWKGLWSITSSWLGGSDHVSSLQESGTKNEDVLRRDSTKEVWKQLLSFSFLHYTTDVNAAPTFCSSKVAYIVIHSVAKE